MHNDVVNVAIMPLLLMNKVNRQEDNHRNYAWVTVPKLWTIAVLCVMASAIAYYCLNCNGNDDCECLYCMPNVYVSSLPI